MKLKPLGRTGIEVSAIAFGAGPIPELMTSENDDRQLAVVRRAIDAGINWFDTAATYGGGQSETSLGVTLEALGAQDAVHVATKARLMPEDLPRLQEKIRESVEESLRRLRLPCVTLLQLHNSITASRGDEPTSVTPHDVLGPGGVLEEFRRLRDEGLVRHIGLTGIGQPAALAEVVSSGEFATMQVPYNLVNPSAGQAVASEFPEADYGNIIAECARQEMGVFAIRVFAGGALVGQPPAAHTYKTKFFPLDLYRRDEQRRAKLGNLLGEQMDVKEAAARFVMSHPDVTSAIVGLSEPQHVDDAVAYLERGPLSAETLEALASSGYDR